MSTAQEDWEFWVAVWQVIVLIIGGIVILINPDRVGPALFWMLVLSGVIYGPVCLYSTIRRALGKD